MVSDRLARVANSVIRDTTAKSIAHGAINLGQGLSRTPPPRALIEAFTQGAPHADQSYGPARGVKRLRTELARKLSDYNHIDYDADTEIVVTVGATGAYSAVLVALLDAGDGIVLIEPFYSYHRDLAQLHGLAVTSVRLDPFNDAITEEKVRSAITPTSRAIVVCNPSNPSGHRMTSDELHAIVAVAEQYDLLIISDEIYEYIYFDSAEPHISPAALSASARDRTITISGFSKTYGVPGWRIGYAASPRRLSGGIAKAADLLTVCPPTPLQEVAVRALGLPPQFYDEVRADLAARRDVVAAAFTMLGLAPNNPQGAYYLLVDCTALQVSDGWEAAEVLLRDYRLATIPGGAFHSTDTPIRPYVRVCFGIDDNDIRRLRTLQRQVSCSLS